MPEPTIRETCPQCHVVFSAGYSPDPSGRRRSRGKRCPNGHWTTAGRLARWRDSAPLLAELGVQRRSDALELSLVTMLECYERLLRTLPAGMLRAQIAGVFGKAPEIAQRILKG